MRYALLLPERDALRPAGPGRLDERLLRRLRRLRGGSWRHQPHGATLSNTAPVDVTSYP